MELEVLLSRMVLNALEASVLAVLVVTVIALVRPSPAWRHSLWLLVLVKLIVPPVGGHAFGLSAACRGVLTWTREKVQFGKPGELAGNFNPAREVSAKPLAAESARPRNEEILLEAAAAPREALLPRAKVDTAQPQRRPGALALGFTGEAESPTTAAKIDWSERYAPEESGVAGPLVEPEWLSALPDAVQEDATAVAEREGPYRGSYSLPDVAFPALSPGVQDSSSPQSPRLLVLEATAPPLQSSAATPSRSEGSDTGRAVSSEGRSVDFAALAFSVTLLGSALFLVWQILTMVLWRRHLRQRRLAPAAVQDLCSKLSSELGLHRAPTVEFVPHRVTPMLWTAGRPRIVLPSEVVSDESGVLLRGVLAHELAHLVRRDHWVSWLELLGGIVYWWFPLYWWTRRELRESADQAADTIAWSAVGSRVGYAELLIEVPGSDQIPFSALSKLLESVGADYEASVNVRKKRDRSVLEVDFSSRSASKLPLPLQSPSN